ncbi:MAG: efflux RND transporter periplasmic adaptor subunit [Acidobacteriaceae bacterium]|nr:efflux RND transporter periplasmic adaptor subunit [Acidobacteriaceae bacterium]
MATANNLGTPDTQETNPPTPPPSGSGDNGARKKPGHSPIAWLMFLIALLLAAVLVYYIGYLPRRKQQEAIDQQARERVQEVPKVMAQVVKPAPATTELMVPGTTLAYTEAYIYARASGYVSRRLVDIGDRVHEGQLLATIDAPDLDKQVSQGRSNLEQSQSTLAQMQAQLHLAAVTWERYKVLVARGVFSRQDGDTQEANFRVAEANVRAAENTVQANRDNLERLIVLQQYERVTAPFNGVITARNVDVGALINAAGSGLGTSSAAPVAGTTQAGVQGNNQGSSGALSSNASPPTGGAQGGEMFSIASIDRLRILVSAPEAYSSAIHVGQRARLFFQERPADVEGHVTRTSASIDQNTRTLLVEVQVNNPGGHLLPGMYVVVNFIGVRGRPPLLVPGEAIVIRNAKTVVATVEDNVVHYRPVVIGRDYGDQTEIVGGLKSGDVIVTTVTDQVRDGARVDPQFSKAAVPSEEGGQSDQEPGEEGRYGAQNLDNSAQKTSDKGNANGGASAKSASGQPGKSARRQEK